MSSSTPHPILLAEYTLGLLNTNETAQAHALLANEQDAARTALAWEESLLELTDLLAPVDPSPLLLQRIQSSLGHDVMPTPASLYRKPDSDSRPAPESAAIHTQTTPVIPEPAAAPVSTGTPSVPTTRTNAAPTPPLSSSDTITTPDTQPEDDATQSEPELHISVEPSERRVSSQASRGKRAKQGNIWFWRCATVVFALLALALALIPSEPVPPPINIVQVAPTQAAILQAPGSSSTPAWVVTVDPNNNILMSPKVRSDIPSDASVQLWTYNKTIPEARSLGLIDPNQPVTVPVSLMGSIGPDQIFEMTLEPKGGSPTASPSGPILFIGRMVTFGAPAQAEPDKVASTAPH